MSLVVFKKKGFDSRPVYNEIYQKTKIKFKF